MTRLGHKKSRKGCQACKKRRVKCDEQAPCRNCLRRNEPCSLAASSPSTPGESANSLPALSQEEWMDDLALMRHFVKETSWHSMGDRHDVQLLWQQVVTDEALKYPFLMHGVLALSALHILHSKHPDVSKFYRLFDHHHTKALESFRGILSSEITAETSTPMFALASTISICSMARSIVMAEAIAEPLIDTEQISEMFVLTRGVRDVVAACNDLLRAGPLAPMLKGYNNPDDAQVILPEPATARLTELNKLITATCTRPDHHDACREALAQLEHSYKTIYYHDSVAEINAGHLFTWMTAVPTIFIDMIRTREVPALILVADFAAATLALDTTWYTKNWGHYCLRGISLALSSSEAQAWLEWPKAQALTNMAILRPSKSTNTSPEDMRTPA